MKKRKNHKTEISHKSLIGAIFLEEHIRDGFIEKVVLQDKSKPNLRLLYDKDISLLKRTNPYWKESEYREESVKFLSDLKQIELDCFDLSSIIYVDEKSHCFYDWQMKEIDVVKFVCVTKHEEESYQEFRERYELYSKMDNLIRISDFYNDYFNVYFI